MAKTIDQIVLEIFDGKWGSGDDRKKKLEKAGYNYSAIQKRINEVSTHMKSRKEAMKPWFDACKAQQEWSYNAKYNWGKWDKTIKGSKNYGTCITFPNVVAMRCGLIKQNYKYITSSGSHNDSKSTLDAFYNSSLKAMSSVNSKYWSSIKYPNKTTAQLVKEGKIKEGDIIGFMGHTASYAYKDSKGNLLFNHAGHAAGIYNNNKAGSNRAVLDVKSFGMSKRKVYGVFSVNTFIVLTSCSNGTISYSDRYMAGQNVVITIKPKTGYILKTLKIDGKVINATTTYKINKIDSHHIVEAICEPEKISKKTIDEIAQEVLKGKWSSGDERKKKLQAAGYDYDAVQKRVNEIIASQKPYQNLKAADYVSSVVYIGQATSDERGKTSGGTAGDQAGGEVNMSKWSYSAQASYNHWTQVCRIKDSNKCLIIAQAMIDTCNNNHIGYDTQSPDRYTAYDAASKVNWDISKITINCETTCSQAVSMCLRAAGVSATYAPRLATVDIIKNKIKESNLFTIYTSNEYVSRSDFLQVGDILISATHVAVVVKAPAPSTKKSYTGTYPSLILKKTNSQVIADTIKWALWIAGDNNFHYGYTSSDKKANAHHNGCYFCGTQRMKKHMLMPEHTYCCNPFVGAAWAHGGCVPTALKLCQKTSSWDFNKGHGYDKSSLFTNLGHPAMSKLKAGDVLCRDTHVALYIGNGKIVQAGHGDDNKKNSARWNSSISVSTLTAANYKNFPRVHRFNGSVNVNMYIRHGEVSNRVKEWQAYLNWYFDDQVGTPDGYYGDNTLKWTKKFQEAEVGKGQGDGIIGPKTLEAAMKVKK